MQGPHECRADALASVGGVDHKFAAGASDGVGDVHVCIANELARSVSRHCMPYVAVATIAQVQHDVFRQRAYAVGFGGAMDEGEDVTDFLP